MKNQPDPDADYHDEDEDVLQLPEDEGDEDEEVDVNEDYEAESDDEPVWLTQRWPVGRLKSRPWYNFIKEDETVFMFTLFKCRKFDKRRNW